MVKEAIVYGPGLRQKSPTITKVRATELLAEQHGLRIVKKAFVEPSESIEIGDYDFARKGFPVWHHSGAAAYPAKYWLDYDVPKSGSQPWIMLDAGGREIDSYSPQGQKKPTKGSSLLLGVNP